MAENSWHSMPMRVYFEDTDAQGVVYFANYLKFMERGRTEYLRALGVEQDELMETLRIGFTLTESEAKFVRPARFNDELSVRTRMVGCTRVRFEIEQAVRRRDGELLCSARCRAACVNLDSFRPQRIPSDLMARLTRPAPTS
ncbi:MAG: tol-pal system-associated acyl-CoA thioesterase [Gammaproteobacteria bacterium]